MLKSLQGKLILIFLSISITAVALSTGFSKYIHYQVAAERAEEIIQDNLELIATELQGMNQFIIKDLLVIRDLPQLKNLIEAKSTANYAISLRETQQSMLSYSNHHSIFNQIRYLDKTGMEIIRIDSDGTNSC